MTRGPMDRRGSSLGACIALVSLLVANHAAAPVAAGAQPPKKVPRIGYVVPNTPTVSAPYLEAFRQGLRELGYVEGKNIALEVRYAEGKPDRLPNLAAELVCLKVDLIVVVGSAGALAAKQATSTIPTVFVLVDDPVGAGLVASLARPGGNVTGLATFAGELIGKRLELLKEAVPRATRVAVLSEPAHPFHAADVSETRAAARALGVQLQVLELRGPHEFESAFAAMTREGADAVLVLPTILTFLHGRRIVDLAGKNRLPVMYAYRHQVEGGGLMSYGPILADMYRRAAAYVDKILKGAKPADLPVEQPTRFELVINMKTAKALGLKFPQSILIRADQVIQ